MCGDRERHQRTHKPKSSCLTTGIACLGARSALTKEHQNISTLPFEHTMKLFYRVFLYIRAVLMEQNLVQKSSIFRQSCRRRFRNAPYGEKILLMGKSYVWAWFRNTCVYMLFYAGEIQNSNCRRLEMASYFSLTRGWGLQEQTKL